MAQDVCIDVFVRAPSLEVFVSWSGSMFNRKMSRGNFVMIASHWPSCIERDLEKTKIVVGNSVSCSDGLDRPFNY